LGEAAVLAVAGGFLAAAILFSTVGLAGASGYLAVMALFGVAPDVMKPTALRLDLFVAAVVTFRFGRAGRVSWSRVWPFAAGSLPFAFLGGALTLPGPWYRRLVGALLVAAAAWIVFETARAGDRAGPARRAPGKAASGVCGAAIGLLAGLTGTGGGIFLAPLFLLVGWADTRETAGTTAAFILVNSAAGLAGNLAHVRALPAAAPVWAAAALLGGVIGSGIGSRRIGSRTFRWLLGAILAFAGGKLLLS